VAPTAAARADRPLRILLDDACVVGFKGGEGSIEHFPARHNHHIQPRPYLESWSDLVAPEQLPRQSLRAISTNSRSQFAACRHTKSRVRAGIPHNDQCHESRVKSSAFGVRAIKFLAAANTLMRRQAARLRHVASLRQRPSDASVPWPGDASAQFGRFSLPFEPGTRGPSYGAACSAETYAFPSCCPTYRKQGCLS